MKPISTHDALPKNKTYVLVHLKNPPWSDQDDPVGLKWDVAKFRRGLSEDERKALNGNEPRKYRYNSSDVFGNNLVPYCWDTFGPDTHFGQDVDYWCELPDLS